MSNDDKRPWPQAGRERMIFPTPIDICAFGVKDPHDELLAKMAQGSVFMMGDNPALPRMPDKPTLIDFFNLRFTGMTNHHLTTAAKRAFDEGAGQTCRGRVSTRIPVARSSAETCHGDGVIGIKWIRRRIGIMSTEDF